MKRFFTSLALALALTAAPALAAPIYIDGQHTGLDTVVQDGTTYVGLRQFVSHLRPDAAVTWEDGQAAVRQAVEIILNVERFRWQIYRPYSGMEWDGLIGQDPGYVGAELQRRVIDALTVDDRVTGISDYDYTVDGSSLSAVFTVNTVYGSIAESLEVPLQ